MRSKERTQWQRRRRTLLGLRFSVAAIGVLTLLFMGYGNLALALAVVAWLLYELFWSERLYYPPGSDYRFNFTDTAQIELPLAIGSEASVENAQLFGNASQRTTLLLETVIRRSASGMVFDPYVVINGKQRQYFERGVNGRRYLNLSHALQTAAGDRVRLQFKHCRNAAESATVLAFPEPDLAARNILVIAPHADDAEIAAFGLYSAHAGNARIVTITAGETEAGWYTALTGDEQRAGRLKGLLRSWDSVAVPQWGGLKKSQAIQLGYFCLSLGQMARNPDEDVVSTASGVEHPHAFRVFNELSLATDRTGGSNWNGLVGDLAELIERFEPGIVVTPHPCYDPHRDHYFASRAVSEALEKVQPAPDLLLLYANHHSHTESFPFGRSGSTVAVPPEFNDNDWNDRVFSFPLSAESQERKLMALTMMHDLGEPLSYRKRFRKRLQQWLLRREYCRYGEDDFLRKAVRANEVFFICNPEQLRKMIAHDRHGYWG